jgi:recombination protein RecR
LIQELSKIPGIGKKTAQRISFFLLKSDRDNVFALARAITDAKEKTVYCSRCNNITDNDPCHICSDTNREKKLCIVEEPFNIFSIEKTRLFSGYYHVLHGNLSPLSGIGPDELKLSNLESRIRDERFEEIILATSPTTEGNATAHYISELLKHLNVKISRLALGLPIGADIDFVDSVTIAKAIEGRIKV